MKKLLLIAFATTLCLAASAQDNTRGYYKDIFMDSGIMLNSRTDLPVTEMLGLSMEAFVSTPHSSAKKYKFTHTDTLRQRELIAGSPIDENGILLYPDGQPRFRMVYLNGGKAVTHGRSLEAAGRQVLRNFVKAGGSYLGSCAGAFIASIGSVKPGDYTTVSHTDTYIGLWPGHAVATRLNKSYTAVDIVADGPLTRYFDFDGRMHIDSVRHNGGCYPNLETAPKGTEILATYNTKGRELERDINGLPVVWAHKESAETGRVVLCGSHPEGARIEADNLGLMAAMVRYALDGNGTPQLKAVLTPGQPRAMTNRSHPAFAPVGDRQYHHFCVEVPKGVKHMTIGRVHLVQRGRKGGQNAGNPGPEAREVLYFRLLRHHRHGHNRKVWRRVFRPNRCPERRTLHHLCQFRLILRNCNGVPAVVFIEFGRNLMGRNIGGKGLLADRFPGRIVGLDLNESIVVLQEDGFGGGIE